MDGKIDWPTDKQTDAEGTNNGQDIHIYIHTYRQTDRQTDRNIKYKKEKEISFLLKPTFQPHVTFFYTNLIQMYFVCNV